MWRLEWRLALRRRRLLLLNTAIPLLLVLPLATGGAPAYHASAAYAVLFVLFGTFGSAIPLLRDGEGGPLRRVILRGIPERVLLAERILAYTALDTLEILPALLVISWVGGAGAPAVATLLASVPPALLAANLVGCWVAALARSIAEGALLAALASLFLLHGSGVFRTPAGGSWEARVEALLPFTPFHEALFAVAGGALPGGGASLGPPLLATFVLLFATLLPARPLLERITSPAP